MLIAICGSQGSGKSTVLNELKKLGQNVVERKTSRSILTDWGVTLQEVNSDINLTFKFQEEISKRKLADEQEYKNSDELWFTERTHTDLFVYTLASIGKDNDNSEWLNKYYTTCTRNNIGYSAVFCLPAGVFKLEHDGVRGSNEHYANNIALLMDHYQTAMADSPNYSVVYIHSITPRQRALAILKQTYTHLAKREHEK